MPNRLRAVAAVLVLGLSACTTGASPAGDTLTPTAAASRTADVDGLVRAVERVHPDPFGAIDETQWRADAAYLRDRAAAMSEDEFLVGVARLAVLGDRNGHGGVFPTDQDDLGMWPLRLHDFGDGWRVVDAADPELVGARLDAIGGRPIAAVTEALEPIVPRDNPHSLRARMGSYLVVPAFLRGLGVLGDGMLTITDADGAPRTIAPPAEVRPEEFIALTGLSVPQIPLTLPAPPRAPSGEYFWSRRERDTLVIGFERVLGTSPGGQRIEDFVAATRAELRAHRPAAVVVDVRRNPGGENERGDPLMALLREVAGDGRTAVRVLIGRGTYSAAALLFAQLDRDVPVTFYGEPTGGGSGSFGNPSVHRLPGSGIDVQIPGRYFTRLGTDVAALEPDMPVETTWADVAAGRDPVLAAALRD